MTAPRLRRPGLDVLLAVVLPVACALSLLLLHPDREQPGDEPPVESPLTAASVVCPGPIAGTGEDAIGVTSLGGSADEKLRGQVQVGLGDAVTPLTLRSGRVVPVPTGTGPTAVAGSGELAPGLVAGRAQTAPLASADCAPPSPTQWFTAVGADATHDSVLELVNADAGSAIADITVRSPAGVLDAPALRGVTVAGGTSTSLDLGQIVPRRGELSLEVRVGRGRLSAHVVDTYDELGSGTRAQDWLPSQPEPTTSNLLLGLAKGRGERTLALANPGADEVRAELKIVTPTSVFAPAGVDPIRVAPDSTESVSLDDVLRQAVQQGATGLLVESTDPVAATLRQVVDDDLSLLAPVAPVDATTGAVVPPGESRLLLAGAEAVGVVTVSSFAANGKQLDSQRLEIAPGTGGDLALPADTRLVTVLPERTSVRAALLTQGAGIAVTSLRQLVLTSLVPGVRPGLP